MAKLAHQNSSFSQIFDKARIPHPIHGIDDLAVEYTPAQIREIGDFADDIVEDLASGRKVRCYFDNDGTLFRFNPVPSDTRMDEACFAGLVRLSQYDNFLATSLTGRDIHEAATFMLTPGYAVKDSYGRIISEHGDKNLRFAVTGSHGVENIDLAGRVTRFNFEDMFGPGVDGFIENFQRDALDLKKRYEGIFIEDTKHGAVGINVRTIKTHDPETKAQAYKEALAVLQGYEDSDANPRHAQTGETVFRIKREGTEELELRPVGFGKDFGILTFGKPEKDVRTLFIGDSFKQPDGTDLDAAILINNKAVFDNGSVIMVRNGRFEPVMDGPAKPRIVFANPTMLGKFLCFVADEVERRRPLLKNERAFGPETPAP